MANDLTDLTVDEQKDELENLGVNQLENLREEEERQTAIDNIDRELSKRRTEEDDEQDEPQEDNVEDDEDGVVGESEDKEYRSKVDRLEQLEAKVDYLIENCKTTSHQGFEDYQK